MALGQVDIMGQTGSGTGRLIPQNSPRVALGQVDIEQSESGTVAG